MAGFHTSNISANEDRIHFARNTITIQCTSVLSNAVAPQADFPICVTSFVLASCWDSRKCPLTVIIIDTTLTYCKPVTVSYSAKCVRSSVVGHRPTFETKIMASHTFFVCRAHWALIRVLLLVINFDNKLLLYTVCLPEAKEMIWKEERASFKWTSKQ